MPRKYTEPQKRLLQRLRQGWTAIVYAREHYCDLLPPPGLYLVALPGVARTVHALYMRGELRIRKQTKDYTVYEALPQ
jgi:hypothetical protein